MRKENDFTSGDWFGYPALVLIIFAIAFAVHSCIYGPKVMPPTYMRTDVPYWYGE